MPCLALGFTIFIHELGHFLAARNRGLVIKKFSIGFGPKLFGWTRKGVEYRLSAIPFGGYVALPQLADMGRIEGSRKKIRRILSHDSWEDEDEENETKKEILPKIGYADKMIVSSYGSGFSTFCLLSYSLGFFRFSGMMCLTRN